MMKYALKQINLHSDVRKLSIYLVQWRGEGGRGEAWASEAQFEYHQQRIY